ncbi:MAG: glycosyltransferase family 39 protein [Calditrichaeota bacterium]|nr:glycosyltransferase family 39 protein [Calditrichota bacterium]
MRRDFATCLLAIVTVVLGVGLSALRFVHLEADPDTSLSRSRVFYTDEGYNSCNAVNKAVTGHWLCDRNNHILLMPVMPTVQYAVFKVAGLSLAAARLPATFLSVLTMVLLLAIVRRRAKEGPPSAPLERWLTLAIAVFLLGTNYYFFVYGRLALLDLPMTAFGLASLVVVHQGLSLRGGRKMLWLFAGAGVLLALAVLTKPSAALYGTALVLLFVLQLLMEQNGRRRLLQGMVVTFVVAGALVAIARIGLSLAAAGYQELTPSHLVTDRIVIHLRTILRNYVKFFNNPVVRKNAPLLVLAYLNVVLMAFHSARSGVLRLTDRVMLALFAACYLFLGFFVHQMPRYFVVLVVPTTYLVATLPANVRALFPTRRGAWVYSVVVLLIVLANGWNLGRLGYYLKEPQYTMRTVAAQIAEEVRRHGGAEGKSAILCGDVAATMALANRMRFAFGLVSNSRPTYLLAQGEVAVPGRELILVRSFDLLGNYYCFDYGRRKMYLYRVGD